jgi:hypothetical protein
MLLISKPDSILANDSPTPAREQQSYVWSISSTRCGRQLREFRSYLDGGPRIRAVKASAHVLLFAFASAMAGCHGGKMGIQTVS